MLTLVTDWERVADEIRSRMDDLALTQKGLAAQANVAENTVRKLLSGDAGKYRRVTLASVSKALGWPGDTLQRIADGEDPFTEDQAPASASGVTGPVDDEVLERLEKMEKMLQELLRREGGSSGGTRT